MKRISRKVTDFNGSRYALIPFFVAELYGIEPGSAVEIDTSDQDVLVLKIKKEA
ncbi:VapB antitoxin [Cuniculiplasma divulgatum]|uniref:VapB antitoxin n=1 Tax=Cuniculiplasma divulgatum TaxID=1673428 RepID=A0A1N5TM65_9ARCH|nr:VapB antitoxin [Cuniculiplasma divulgatum]